MRLIMINYMTQEVINAFMESKIKGSQIELIQKSHPSHK
jgi:hypothetical protein